DLLRGLAGAETSPRGQAAPAQPTLDAVSSRADAFTAWLRERNLRSPDGTPPDVPTPGPPPDLVYRLENGKAAAVYLNNDGDQQEDERLRDDGWLVIRIGRPEDWERTVARFPTVFGSLGGEHGARHL